MTIGEIVKEAREKKGLSARKLAELCNVSHTEINNIESGKREKPSLYILKAFQDYIDLNYRKLAKMVGYTYDEIEFFYRNEIINSRQNKVVVNIFNKNKELKKIINEYHDNVLDLIEFDTHKREVYDKARGDLNQLILWFRLYDVYKHLLTPEKMIEHLTKIYDELEFCSEKYDYGKIPQKFY